MEEYYHEHVLHKEKIPAMIEVLTLEDLAIYFPKEMFIPAHWHRSLEISLIENAEVVLQVGNRTEHIEDDFTCVNSSELHALRAEKVKENSRCILLLLSYDFIKQYYPDIDLVYFDMSCQKNHDELKALYYRLADLYRHQDEWTYLEINACLLEILSHLLRHYTRKKHDMKTTKYQEVIKQILAYIHQHYQEPLTLSSVADYFHVSKEHFSRQFHQYVGKTFKDYLSNYRLYKAYDDIVSSDLTIQVIASKHGFYNVKSFINLFHEMYGLTPLQYRKQIKKSQ